MHSPGLLWILFLNDWLLSSAVKPDLQFIWGCGEVSKPWKWAGRCRALLVAAALANAARPAPGTVTGIGICCCCRERAAGRNGLSPWAVQHQKPFASVGLEFVPGVPVALQRDLQIVWPLCSAGAAWGAPAPFTGAFRSDILLAPRVICVCSCGITYCIICFSLSASTAVPKMSPIIQRSPRAGRRLQSAKHIPVFSCTLMNRLQDRAVEPQGDGEAWEAWEAWEVWFRVCHSPNTAEGTMFFWFFIKLTEKSAVQCGLLLFSLGLARWKVVLYFKWLV